MKRSLYAPTLHRLWVGDAAHIHAADQRTRDRIRDSAYRFAERHCIRVRVEKSLPNWMTVRRVA